ncbi:hypothetical protein J8L85_11065 [Maribacter sp. MMG018]|uniref:hypothetical protein n=1 Tax=Maribacter sp. MMG018 TaxID=2822688 RepID=UPI001B36017D|nr:hypothetical protein [Maribacter sp. MMG018]MBQ4914980.1 hypothetical protein [Maribacter sp. MMG018]
MIDHLTAFSILLVFQGLLFSHIGKTVNEFLKQERPSNIQPKKLKNWKKDKNLLMAKSILSTIFCLLIWYLSVPEVYNIISTSNIDFFEFDVIKTSFTIISISLLAIVIIMLFWIYKMINK